MILGYTIDLPVVAAVAANDRWNHFLRCPYCGAVHSHGGFGPTSPFGAIDDARFVHCRTTLDGVTLLQESGVLPEYYVLKEVPGTAVERHPEPDEGDYYIREITYDYDRIAGMGQDIAAAIAAYESRWEGVDRPRGGQFHPAQIAFRRGEIPWLSAYVDPNEAPSRPPVIPARPIVAGPPCAIYLHFDANDVLLYVGITDDLAVRAKRHASRSSWVQFAVRGEVVWCANRTEASRREVELIRELRPLFNDKHAAPDRDERLVAYLASKGRYDLLTPAISRG